MHQLSAFLDEPRALDVFAYRSYLFVLTHDGHLLSYDVQELAQNMHSAYGEDGLIVAYGLFSSKGIGAFPAMRTAWRAFDHETSRRIDLRFPPTQVTGFAIEASAYLDMRIFYGSLYIATDVGTFRVPLEKSGQLPRDGSSVERLLSEPTTSLSTGMGAVGASLGEEGLAVFTGVVSSDERQQMRIESRSLRSSIGWGAAVNYPTHDSYEILETEVEDDASGRRRLKSVALSEKLLSGSTRIQEGSYSVWESGRLLIADTHGVTSFGRIPGRRRPPIGRAEVRPLWMGATGNGWFVRECSDHIVVSRNRISHSLYNGEVASIRTFPTSQRYKRLIASTVEDGIVLSAVMDSFSD